MLVYLFKIENPSVFYLHCNVGGQCIAYALSHLSAKVQFFLNFYNINKDKTFVTQKQTLCAEIAQFSLHCYCFVPK